MAEIYSFELNGVLDNCLDFVDNVVPNNTKFTNSIRKVPARTPTFKWVTDVNDSISVKHGQVEGVEFSAATTSNGLTIRNAQDEITNYAQRFSKFVSITKTAAATAVHGRTSETEYQLQKAVKSIKNQIEATFLSTQTKDPATFSNPALTDGAKAQLPTTCVVTGAVDAANVKKLLDALFSNGSSADTIMCGKDVYEALAKLSNGYVDGVKIDGKPVPSFVDAQGNVFGVISSRYLADGSMFVYNSNDWSMVVFRDWKISKLASFGSTDRYLVECEVGLRHDGKFMSGMIVPTPASPASPASNEAVVATEEVVITKAGKTKTVAK